MMERKTKSYYICAVIRYLFLIIFGIIFLIPFVWLVSSGLKTPQEIYAIPPTWIPHPIAWSNFTEAWQSLEFGTYYKNTLILVALGTVGTVFSCILVAYGFAKFKSKASSVMFMIVISTMMLPMQVTMIPTYMLFSSFHWVNTMLPLVIPQWFATGAFYIFLLRQFFRTIPKELDDAALIDGCGSFRYLWQIIVPLSKPSVITVTVFTIINNGNDYLSQLLYLQKREAWTIAVGLASFNSKYGTQQMNLLMAASFLALIPLLIIFFVAQRYFVQGIATSGIKG